MSHKISVQGTFGSAECLRATLTKAGQAFTESKEGGDTYLVLSRHYNPIKICLNDPSKSSMDHMNGNEVAGWYRDSMAAYVKQRLLVDGHSVTSETRQGQNIVLRVAVG